MAKKKKQQQEQPSSSQPATPAAATSTSTPSDAEAARLQRAFDLGNFSQVRALAASAATPAAKETAARLLPLVKPEPQQLLVGLFGVVVVVIACLLALTRG